jgi:hypothetical protein
MAFWFLMNDELARRGIKWEKQTTHRLYVVSRFHGWIFFSKVAFKGVVEGGVG